mmetsp:Transcript_8611/g.17349  ORF Transcript_8611/g.17349 Transcript_8611/m.17349 type:complete len:543 (-) Transcript_8611:211-1839(-)
MVSFRSFTKRQALDEGTLAALIFFQIFSWFHSSNGFAIKPTQRQPIHKSSRLSYQDHSQVPTPTWPNFILNQYNSLRRKKVNLQVTSSSNYYSRQQPRENIRLPLLVSIENDGSSTIPLPNSHLPEELATASLYELEVKTPVHKMVIQEAIAGSVSSSSSLKQSGRCYGHIVWKKDDADGLVGAIGCAGEIFIGAPSSEAYALGIFGEDWQGQGVDISNVISSSSDGGNESVPLYVLARGSYRFRVKEVVSSIPYPIAIVDEIIDEELCEGIKEKIKGSSNDDDFDNDDIYSTLSQKELVPRVLQSLQEVLKNQLEKISTPLTPLEQSILENAPSSTPMAQAIQNKFDAEERMAVFETFTASLLDIAPDERDRMFAVAMMAGELVNLPSELRVEMIKTVDGEARLRLVLRELSSIVAMDSARRMAKSISLGDTNTGKGIESSVLGTDSTSLKAAEDSKKELKVGTPQLPSWADQIQIGVRVEYFWNEIEGWCAGTVVDDPIKILDELVVSVKFDDDGSTHRLPFRGDEKARWRPPMDDASFG